MKTKLLREDEVEFEIACEPEDEDPADYFESGDKEADAEDVKKINEDVKWNPWAWCCVVITASYKGFKGVATLGACSYTDEEDFRKNSGYYEDLRKDALDRLNEGICEIAKAIPLEGE